MHSPTNMSETASKIVPDSPAISRARSSASLKLSVCLASAPVACAAASASFARRETRIGIDIRFGNDQFPADTRHDLIDAGKIAIARYSDDGRHRFGEPRPQARDEGLCRRNCDRAIHIDRGLLVQLLDATEPLDLRQAGANRLNVSLAFKDDAPSRACRISTARIASEAFSI